MKKTNERTTNRRARYDICRDQERVMMRLEMPGVDKSGLEINLEGDKLTIEGRRQAAESTGQYLIREIRTGDYHMEFSIDETIDRDSVEAELTNGVLRLSLGLSERVKPRKIEVVAR